MTPKQIAKRELAKWRNKYKKEYQHYQNTWSFVVVTTAERCRKWKKELDKLEGKE
jgi:hypothetical protein